MVIDSYAMGEAIARTQERLRMPSLSLADAEALSGRKAKAFREWCQRNRIRACARGRYRRRDIVRGLENETRLTYQPKED